MMEIVYRKLSDIKPNPKNPRKGSPEAVQKLAESIKANPKFFEARPVLLSDRTGELVIIGGERRSEAAALAGLKKVPTILMTGLTEEQEDEIMVRDNTHAGVWDEVKLKAWPREKLEMWNAPKWSDVTEKDLQGLFAEHHTNTQKPTFIVVEVPHYLDAGLIREKVQDVIKEFPDCKIK